MTTKKAESNVMVIRDHADMAIFNQPMDSVIKTIRDNLGASRINANQFDRISFPVSGAQVWEIPGILGNEFVPVLEGIIIHWENRRVYWQGEYSGQKTLPDCYSPDGMRGIGNPGGECDLCPLAEFGSAARGAGQACKAIRRVFLVQPGEILPVLISIPPTNVNALSKFFLRLTSKNIPYYGVTVSLGLDRYTTRSGQTVSMIVPQVTGILDAERRAEVEVYKATIEAALSEIPMTAEDYQTNGI